MSQPSADNPYTRGVADFVAGLTYDSIPAEIRQRIKLLMLDAFGCGLYAADLEWSRILQRTLGGLDTTRACAVWGAALKLSAPHAALINGTQVQGFELDAGKTVHALGIAGTQACGLMAAQFGSMVKRMHAGRAAQSGLYGAQLADAGFTGILNVFESDYGGFCTTFSRSTDRFKLAELTAGFGGVWQTMNVALKFYSCVGSTHSTLNSIRELQVERAFGADDVDKIVVHGSEATVNHVGWKYVPQGFTAAQLNLSYCVATLLLDGEVFVDQFTEEKLTDSVRMALAARVSVEHDPAITARGPKFRQMVRVDIFLKDGTRLERIREMSRAKETFAGESAVVKKFETLAAHALPAGRARELCNSVLNLEKLDDASRLAELLAAA